MPINQCRKGKRVELELVHFLKDNGLASARRSEQHNGCEGLSDVLVPELPHFHIESKGTKPSELPQSKLRDWIVQMDRDCPSNQIPVLFWKANGKEWTVLITHGNFARANLELACVEVVWAPEETLKYHTLLDEHLWKTRIELACDRTVIKPAFRVVTLVTPSKELATERVLFAMPAIDFIGIMKAYEVQVGSSS